MLLILTYRRIVMRNYYTKTGVNVKKMTYLCVHALCVRNMPIRQMISLFYA